MKQTNQERAKELFEKEPNVSAAYFTKDGNMFRAEHYARDWAKGSNGGEVETIYRDGAKAESAEAGTDEAGTGAKVKAVKPVAGKKDVPAGEAEEKAELTKRYIELFDTKPNHMTGIPKLKELIAAKELENKNGENQA